MLDEGGVLFQVGDRHELLIQHSADIFKNELRLFCGVSDASEANLPDLGRTSEQVEDGPFLESVIELQVFSGLNGFIVIPRTETFEEIPFEVVSGDIELVGLGVLLEVGAFLLVCVAGNQSRHLHEGVRGASPPDIYFNAVQVVSASILDCHEVHCKAIFHSFFG